MPEAIAFMTKAVKTGADCPMFIEKNNTYKEYTMSTDWLPGKRIEQLAMAKTWISVLREKGEAWQVTHPEQDELSALANTADELLAQAMAADRNAVITARCNEAFDNLHTNQSPVGT